ncbi:hypothetical protein TTRE_0000604601 [Trichuris trichiura]|uniref:Uncharacterized protein n=1 Tax=Trichuris trichiura TaxID=36087 RepID=A0A077ZBK6_TRITR|nr:hypothetical protein TTRE_0000604601 [Trichuris trichiura]
MLDNKFFFQIVQCSLAKWPSVRHLCRVRERERETGQGVERQFYVPLRYTQLFSTYRHW